MKKILIHFLFFISISLLGQTSTLTININLACGGKFPNDIEVRLFEWKDNVKTPIASSISNPAVFKNLDADRPYELYISTKSESNYQLTAEDVFQVKKQVLGLTSKTNAMKIGNDTDNNFDINTIDIIKMSRDVVDVQNLNNKGWFFISSDNAFINTPSSNNYLNTLYIEKIAEENKEINFIAFEKYHSKALIPVECNNCGIQENHAFDLITSPQNLSSGIVKKIPIFLLGNSKNIEGFRFTLKVKDAIIQNVDHENEILSKVSVQNDKVVFLSVWPYNQDYPIHVADVDILPSENGDILQFLELDYSSPIEVLTFDTTCVSNSTNLKFNTSNVDCSIEWPPLLVTVPDCINEYVTGKPVVEEFCKQFITTTFNDKPINNPDGSCNKIIRTWTVLNWLSSIVVQEDQIINFNNNHNTVCNTVEVKVPSSGKNIEARSLIKNSLPNHTYTFNINDAGDSTKFLDNIGPLELYFSVYDLQDSSFCVAFVKKDITCDPTLNIKPIIYLNANNELYTINASDFDEGNTNLCKGSVEKFLISTQKNSGFQEVLNFEYESYKGLVVELYLKYYVNGLWLDYAKVYASLLPKVRDESPLKLQCFNLDLTENVLQEVPFFSSNFIEIYAMQGAIKAKDAEVIDARTVNLKFLSFNNQENISTFIWLNDIPASFSPEDTLFTITILPKKSGKLSEFLEIDDETLESMVVLNNLNDVNIILDFNLINSVNDNKPYENSLSVGPNPILGNELNYFLPKEFEGCSFHLINTLGNIVLSGETPIRESNGIIKIPSNVINGLYLLTFVSSGKKLSKKIILTR